MTGHKPTPLVAEGETERKLPFTVHAFRSATARARPGISHEPRTSSEFSMWIQGPQALGSCSMDFLSAFAGSELEVEPGLGAYLFLQVDCHFLQSRDAYINFLNF